MLAKAGRARSVVSAEAIEQATMVPPNTRAKIRGRFIAAARAAGEQFTVDWVHLRLNNKPQFNLQCKDPFESHSDEVQMLLNAMRQTTAEPWSPPFI